MGRSNLSNLQKLAVSSAVQPNYRCFHIRVRLYWNVQLELWWFKIDGKSVFGNSKDLPSSVYRHKPAWFGHDSGGLVHHEKYITYGP